MLPSTKYQPSKRAPSNYCQSESLTNTRMISTKIFYYKKSCDLLDFSPVFNITSASLTVHSWRDFSRYSESPDRPHSKITSITPINNLPISQQAISTKDYIRTQVQQHDSPLEHHGSHQHGPLYRLQTRLRRHIG